MAIDPEVCGLVRALGNMAAVQALGGRNLVGCLRLDNDGTYQAFVPDVECNEVSVSTLDPSVGDAGSTEYLPMFAHYDRGTGKYTVALRSCNWLCDECQKVTGLPRQAPSSHCKANAITDPSVAAALGGSGWLCVFALQTDGRVESYYPDVPGNEVSVRASDSNVTNALKEHIMNCHKRGIDDCLVMRDAGGFPLYLEPRQNNTFIEYIARGHAPDTRLTRRLIRKILLDRV